MSAHSKDEGLAEALEWIEEQLEDLPADATVIERFIDVKHLRALLSTSSAVRGMREALEDLIEAHDDLAEGRVQARKKRIDNGICAYDNARAAIEKATKP